MPDFGSPHGTGRLPRVQLHRPTATGLLVTAVSLAASTVLAFVLVRVVAVPDAAIVYLLAVVTVGTAYGSMLAIATSITSFLIYDFLFVKPYYTFNVASSEEWLDLLLFLVVAIVIGRLSALQLQRRREAEFRTAEARAMFAISREIADSASLLEAAPRAAARLAREADMTRVWVGLGHSPSEERVVADSRAGEPRPVSSTRWVLHSTSAEVQPTWARVHDPSSRIHQPAGSDHEARAHESLVLFRVPIQAGSEPIGSLWGTRPVETPFPGRSHSRLLAATADQLGQAVVRDRLAAEATTAEVARQGEALKSALLDSVSHDLRTPLAAIRAAAGNLMDPAVQPTRDETRSAARSIDLEAERLSRLVRNMLDLSRIEANALHPSLELYDLADLIDPVVDRLAPALAAVKMQVSVPSDLPPVKVDAMFLDEILTNLLENAARYAAGQSIELSAGQTDGVVELVVEDGGPGVPASAMPHLFERFYRLPARPGTRTEGGSGIGLTVVKGLTEAMGGSVSARASALGGLAVAVRLPCQDLAEEGEYRDLTVEPSGEPGGTSAAPEPATTAAPAPSKARADG